MTGLETDEYEALMFLYAYMPIGDMVNFPTDYWLANYRVTKKAMETMPWGKTVPERELRHFVLPVRVNNENLDVARLIFYEELAPLVKEMNMYDAVLEINHWCHSKAVYRPTDSRTCSPLTIVSTAYGRCGEESTFLVAALRSVGIPARQVYTPRWAHTDDNHAWVEAWVDGKWYFLGACEPEPILNLAWFNAPASRGMLMHTKVFGAYDGPEEVVKITPNYTEINVIQNYAPKACKAKILVVDTNGKPVSGASVEYRLYNYAEFYPVAKKTADNQGISWLTAGEGDMLIYATDGENFGFKKVSFGKESNVEIVLDHKEGDPIEHISMEIVPPSESSKLPEVTAEQRELNTERMIEEDSIRMAYTETFPKRCEIIAAISTETTETTEAIAGLVEKSRGNHYNIMKFIRNAEADGKLETAVKLLQSISEKDLQDTPAYILEDHLYYSPENADPQTVLCPRVASELLTAYRKELDKQIPETLASSFMKDPSTLVTWCKENLTMADSISQNYVNIEPIRVWQTRLADKSSRDIFFVACCRTLGISAWQDKVTGKLKYQHNGQTYEVNFEADEVINSPQGKVLLDYKPIPMLEDPTYYTHFTLSRFENGSFHLLNFDEGTHWSTTFKNGCKLDCGYYMLVSGSRLSNGNVLTDIEFFTIEDATATQEKNIKVLSKDNEAHGKGTKSLSKDGTFQSQTVTRVPLVLRDDKTKIRVIGSFNSEAIYDALEWDNENHKFIEKGEKSILATTGRGYFAVALIEAGKEPTDHVLRDISLVANEFDSWGRPLIILFSSEKELKRFEHQRYNLPKNTYWGIDRDGSIRKMTASSMELNGKGSLPIVLIADTFNRVVFFSEGYSIGIGERLARVCSAL